MRQIYHIRLDALGEQAASLCRLSSNTLRDATEAVLTANLHLAEQVIAADVELDRLRGSTETVALELLALQAPVASDLRVVISALWIVADLQRMGGLAIHVAKVGRRRFPDHAVPPSLRPVIKQMGIVGVEIADTAEQVLLHRDLDLARTVGGLDDAMDELQQQIFAAVNAPTWAEGILPAVDAAMLGRFYERFGDHAVAVSRRVIFLVTGQNVGGDTTPTSLPPH
jgi:phosphate transport system protein